LDDLRSAIGAFIRERDWEQFHSPKNLAMALSAEVAEIVEHFQWLTEKTEPKPAPPEAGRDQGRDRRRNDLPDGAGRQARDRPGGGRLGEGGD
jgi:NTP pyrophosphatase (non-canonical NTP hydrolase)